LHGNVVLWRRMAAQGGCERRRCGFLRAVGELGF
jgi:hypothetical protein